MKTYQRWGRHRREKGGGKGGGGEGGEGGGRIIHVVTILTRTITLVS